MALNDTVDIRQPYASALEFFGAVEALKDPEELVGISHVESDAVVANKEYGLVGMANARSNFDFRLKARPRIFQGIRQKIDQYQAKHSSVTLHKSHGLNIASNISSFIVFLEFKHDFASHVFDGELGSPNLRPAHAGESQKVIYHLAHLFCCA
jgi:hypothetical protein